ncbi:MAG: hypothetical protein KatS3mg105_3204 [Gemmatales bacterium]|nr:MAG: hypothetical protein KatS3mg105_3204 [Gemmatales bacterium]
MKTLFAVSLGVAVVLVVFLVWQPATETEGVMVYCAAGMKKPVEEIARAYEKELGVKVRLEFRGSRTLLANFKVVQQGDLYIPGDDYYIELARDEGYIDEVIPIARMTPVFAVQKGNPKKIQSLDDLLNGKVRVAQTDPQQAACGRLTKKVLEKLGKWQELDKITNQTGVYKPNVIDVATDVKVGAVDVGIVWDSTVAQFQPDLEAVEFPELKDHASQVTVGVLRFTKSPPDALRFARYLTSEKGLPIFEKYGFKVVEGDQWAVTPELKLFAGAMLRPAIQETIREFEKREGVKVTTVYNGCGILVAQMRTKGERPDAYFACETSFMQKVSDLFLDPTDVSQNRLVIVVPKGNPKNIKTLEDLARPGLRIGVGHEQKCAMGAITKQTLEKTPFYDKIMKNVLENGVQSPTGDLLINQMVTGSLDAVIAYVSNAAMAADKLDAYTIEGIPCAIATQPFAVGKNSKYKHLSNRLLEAIKTAQSKKRFEEFGFKWKLKEGQSKNSPAGDSVNQTGHRSE